MLEDFPLVKEDWVRGHLGNLSSTSPWAPRDVSIIAGKTGGHRGEDTWSSLKGHGDGETCLRHVLQESKSFSSLQKWQEGGSREPLVSQSQLNP